MYQLWKLRQEVFDAEVLREGLKSLCRLPEIMTSQVLFTESTIFKVDDFY